MSQTLVAFGVALGVVVLYLGWTFGIWRKWRREFEYDELLLFSLVTLVLSVVGYGGGVLLGLPWFGAGVGWFVGVLVAHALVDLDAWEVADFAAVGWMWSAGVVAGLVGAYAYVAVGLFAGAVALLVARSFRRFMWYRSGSPGLPFLTSLAVFFLLNFGIAIVLHQQLYFVPVIGTLLVIPIIYFRAVGPKQSWQRNKRKRITLGSNTPKSSSGPSETT